LYSAEITPFQSYFQRGYFDNFKILFFRVRLTTRAFSPCFLGRPALTAAGVSRMDLSIGSSYTSFLFAFSGSHASIVAVLDACHAENAYVATLVYHDGWIQ
jgi:hypothetical protein